MPLMDLLLIDDTWHVNAGVHRTMCGLAFVPSKVVSWAEADPLSDSGGPGPVCGKCKADPRTVAGARLPTNRVEG